MGGRRPDREGPPRRDLRGTFEGVARKLERLHVDKDEDQIPRTGKEAYRRLFTERTCPDCGGVRLNAAARAVELAGGWTIGRLVGCELTKLDRVLEDLVAQDDYEPIRDVVATLVARMRLARQLDCDLVDLIYILNEPTVRLHLRDIDHLIAMLRRLRDHGNSVLVVEHDPAVIRAADWIVDIGPRAGEGGGELLFCGRLDDLLRSDTTTSRALNEQVARPRRSRRTFDDAIRIENATTNNLRNLSVRIPKGVLTCVTGVAGSGKSSLVAELIDPLRRRPAGGGRGGEVVVVDQRSRRGGGDAVRRQLRRPGQGRHGALVERTAGSPGAYLAIQDDCNYSGPFRWRRGAVVQRPAVAEDDSDRRPFNQVRIN